MNRVWLMMTPHHRDADDRTDDHADEQLDQGEASATCEGIWSWRLNVDCQVLAWVRSNVTVSGLICELPTA